MATNGHNAMAIAHAKYSVWVKKKNCLTHAKNVSTNTLKLCYAKNGCKKQLIFEKWEHFENGKKWPHCKGYSPCKIARLDQKINCLKHGKNVFISTLELFDAKYSSKKQQINKKWKHFENGQKWLQCKGLCIVASFALFQNALIFPILIVFWSRFLHRTTQMCLYKRLSHLLGNFISWHQLSISNGL